VENCPFASEESTSSRPDTRQKKKKTTHKKKTSNRKGVRKTTSSQATAKIADKILQVPAVPTGLGLGKVLVPFDRRIDSTSKKSSRELGKN